MRSVLRVSYLTFLFVVYSCIYSGRRPTVTAAGVANNSANIREYVHLLAGQCCSTPCRNTIELLRQHTAAIVLASSRRINGRPSAALILQDLNVWHSIEQRIIDASSFFTSGVHAEDDI